MNRFCSFFSLLTLLLFADAAKAQGGNSDSLFAVLHQGRAMVMHTVRENENLYSIAQKYSVPALVLSQNNDVSFYEKLVPGRLLMIPLGNYNYQQTGDEHTKRIYYRLQKGDTYLSVADIFDIKEQSLRQWNNDAGLAGHHAIAAGWIAYTDDAPKSKVVVTEERTAGTGSPVAPKAAPAKEDTAKPKPSDLELIYNYQTTNGTFFDSLSGMVVFFKPQTTVNSKLLYAFSNDIGRGRVIKVVNPSNQKFVFAKVIGPLPATKQYINAKIGLDGRARAALETREVKLWCDFFFKY
ncbi:MAG: LysM peptidoglycan-binding domain-containing protein [Chitinophagaceae bacterium]|nr:LysM peptidoglycan-binding domain-containing protein [Chitinophagaceae bacterium]